MAIIKAKDIIARAGDILFDTTQVRWPEAELLRWLNDAQREVVLQRPDAKAINESVSLVVGSRQSIPPTGLRLIDVIRNMGAGTIPGRAIVMVDRAVLDAQRPLWHTETNTAKEAKHFVFDARDPKRFYVYPPVETAKTFSVEVVYSVAPADCVSGESLIDLDDIYAGPVLDWILFRAYSKDSEFAGNTNRAATHYQAFYSSIGAKSQVDAAMSPRQTETVRRAAR